MSDTKTDKAKGDKPAGKGGKIKKIGLGLVALTLLGGGGAAAGYYVAGAGEGGAAHPDPNVPQLVPRGAGADGGEHGEAAPAAAPAAGGEHGAPIPTGGAEQAVDGSRYTATYYPVETPFTSNLKDSDSFVQLTLGVATYYDSRVIDNVRAHEVAIRSAVLMRLAEQDPDLVSLPAGRTLLQRDLTQAINQVLREKTGFGGIDNVYFTSFVVQ